MASFDWFRDGGLGEASEKTLLREFFKIAGTLELRQGDISIWEGKEGRYSRPQYLCHQCQWPKIVDRNESDGSKDFKDQ